MWGLQAQECIGKRDSEKDTARRKSMEKLYSVDGVWRGAAAKTP